MGDFKSCIARGAVSDITAAELDAILARREWFSVARIVREHLSGQADEVLKITAASRGTSSLALADIDTEKLLGYEKPTPAADDIIERFLQSGDYRIVADNGSDDGGEDVVTEAEFGEEDDLVSEELAEIYLSQGLKNEALAIYRKLSLLNTEKSVYFAEIIDKIENNN